MVNKRTCDGLMGQRGNNVKPRTDRIGTHFLWVSRAKSGWTVSHRYPDGNSSMELLPLSDGQQFDSITEADLHAADQAKELCNLVKVAGTIEVLEYPEVPFRIRRVVLLENDSFEESARVLPQGTRPSRCGVLNEARSNAKDMSFDDFVKKNPGIVVKKRGRWGTYHYQIKSYVGNYQDASALSADTEREVYRKIFDLLTS